MARVPGPLVGLALLIGGHKSVEFANFMSSLVYTAALPLSIIGSTLFYVRLKETERAPAVLSGEPTAPSEPASLEVAGAASPG